MIGRREWTLGVLAATVVSAARCPGHLVRGVVWYVCLMATAP